MSRRISRRQFLRGTAVGGVGLVILRNPSSAWSFQANESVGVALVGVAGRGSWFVSILDRPSMRPVAMCDVDNKRAAEAFGKYPDVPKFDDFRVMLDKAGRDIDGVIVSTPEFSRATILATCMRAGKHVYGEKPLTREPYESRALRELARQSNLATQMGNQVTGDGRLRQAVRLVQAGLLGEVREVHVWNSASRPEGDAPPEGGPEPALPSGSQPVPPYLSWDAWLAGSAARDYHEQWYKGWRGFRDFGTSGLGWWGPHSANMPFLALRIGDLWDATGLDAQARAIRITPTVPRVYQHTFPAWEMVRYEVPARGEMPPVALTWHKGAMHFLERAMAGHAEWRDMDPKPWWVHSGSVLIGSKGKLDATEYGAIWRSYPAELKNAAEIQGIRGMGHEEEWLAGCRGQGQTWSNFVHAGAFNEFLMLGNVATKVGEPFTFDPVTGRVLDNDAAQAALHTDYRDGWSL